MYVYVICIHIHTYIIQFSFLIENTYVNVCMIIKHTGEKYLPGHNPNLYK